MKFIFAILALALSACTTLSKPFFYEASQYSNRVFIFGTIHAGVPIDDVPSSIISKIDASQNIVAEIDPERTSLKENITARFTQERKEIFALLQDVQKKNPKLAKGLSEKMEMTLPSVPIVIAMPELKLSQRLSPKAFALAQNYLSMIEPDLLERISPAAASRFIAETRLEQVSVGVSWANRFDPKFSLDLNLLSRAAGQNKFVTQLDDDEVLSPHCQDLLDSIQIVDIFEKGLVQKVKDLDRLVDVYKTGEEKKMIALTNELGGGTNVCTLDERNQKWLPTIIQATERAGMYGNPPAFVLVGAAHLFGPQGILELLKRSGFSVQRVEKY